MTTIADHEAAIAALLGAVPTREREVPVTAEAVAHRPGHTRARRLARDVAAVTDVPLFDNSQMDGYAVRAADLAAAAPESPVTLPVAPPIAAGEAGGSLPAGFAVPIMTGAPIPAGADAVVPVERTEPGSFDASHVTFSAPVDPGAFLRLRGVDVRVGDLVAVAGAPLRPAHVGAFAAAGVVSAAVRSRVRVLVVTTGRELDATTGPSGDGSDAAARIPDAVGGMLARAVADAGGAVRAIVCPSDEPDRLWALLHEVGEWPDVIVTVGGVSHGAYEVVKLAFGDRGVDFAHLALQPGGPQGLGTIALGDRTVPVLAFPGNPVSALISFELFLRPWLRERAGLLPAERRRERRVLASPLDSPAHQHQIRRGSLRDDGRAEPVGGPGSHLIAHYAAADCLLHVPVGTARLEAGDEVEVWILDD